MAIKLFEAIKNKRAKENAEIEALKKKSGYEPGIKGNLHMMGDTVGTVLTGGIKIPRGKK